MRVKSFALMEIMIVCVVVITVAALAIPNMLRTRCFAQQVAALEALRAIAAAQGQYRAVSPNYANLSELGSVSPAYLDTILGCPAGGDAGSCLKQSYIFRAVPDDARSKFYATAAPQALQSSHTYYVDEGGFLCQSNTTNTPAPAAHSSGGCPAGFSQAQ